MLKNLILGHEKSDFVLIEDSVERPASGLLKAFVTALAGRHDAVHVYLYEMTPTQFTFGLPSSVVEKLKIQDMTIDPFGWTTGTALFGVAPKIPNGEKTALVIDNLTNLVQADSCAAVCRMVHQLTGRSECLPLNQTFEQTVSVVHRDVLDGAALRALEYTARCTVNLCGAAVDSNAGTMCHTGKVHDTGKFSASDECFRITDSFTFESVPIPKVNQRARQKPAPDPTSNLTFRLTLKEAEVDARRQLVLPYLSARHEMQPELTGGQHSDDINATYDPDEDDYEDEDPDDDLDI